MKIQKSFLNNRYILCFFLAQLQGTPPPPPPLPGALASQSIAQLLKMFSTSSQNVSLASLMRTTASTNLLSTTNTTAISQSVSTTNQQSSGSTATSGGGSVTAVLNTLTDPNTPLNQKIQMTFGSHTNADGSAIKITPSNQYQMSPSAQALNKSFASNFTGSNDLQLPLLKFTDSNVTSAYNNFVASFKENPSFISMFKKIHITAMHQLYQYLVGIHVTLNLININDIKTYIILEKQFGLNKKTLITGHLVNLMQEQLTQIIQGVMPGMPDQVAIRAGISALQNEGGTHLNMFILDKEKSLLALIGIDPLTADQVALMVKTLNLPANVALIKSNSEINQAAYQQALAIMSPSNASFVQQLSPDQANAMAEALNSVSLGVVNAQKIESVQNIINQLSSPNQSTQLASQDLIYFIDLMNQIAYGLPLNQIVTLTDTVAQKVTSQSTAPFSAIELASVNSILGYVLTIYERNLSTNITQAITMLGNLNPTNMILSVSQQVSLQSIAQEMLATTNPLTLEQLSSNDYALLTSALIIFAQNPPGSIKQFTATYQTLGTQMSTSVMLSKNLTSDQSKALQAALTYLASFILSPTTLASAEQLFSAQDQSTIQKAFTTINDPKFTSFSVFDKRTQLLLLSAIQKLDAIAQTRMQLHTADASTLEGVFGEDDTIGATLILSLSMDDYDQLATLYEYIQTQKTAVSASSLAANFQSQSPSPFAVFQKILSPSSDPTKPNYIDILHQVAQQNSVTSVVQQVIQKSSSTDLATYQNIADSIKNRSFSFSKLTPSQSSLLLSLFQPLQTALTQSMATAQSTSSIDQLLQSTSRLVAQTHNFNLMKNSYLWVLKQYLLFFNAYTASLLQYSNTVYQGITNFTNQAKLVTNMLKNSPIQTTNPPLFFYDDATMRSLRMLPQLAQLVANTDHVPYPTFCVEQALNGTTINPTDGIIYNNTVTMGQGAFVYKKFFFLDSTQQSAALDATTVLPELINADAQKISWLKKVPVPVSNTKITVSDGTVITNYDHIYVAQNKPNDLSGFYMNIPTFNGDPTDPSKIVIRLFEQEIIAQPDWLNNSGLTKDSSGVIAPGVMTVLRGCMGDFMSVLDLGVFDPCLTTIFRSALAVTPASSVQTTATAQTNPNFVADAQNCGLYLQEKALELQRMQQGTTVQNAAISSATSSNAGGSISVGTK